MGNISAILDSGLDAFNNLYDVIITWPTRVTEEILSEPSISVRIGDITPPSLDAGKYSVPYKGITLPRLNALIEGERSIDIPIRIDAEHKILRGLYAWKHLWANPSDETDITFGSYTNRISLGDPSVYGTILVKGYRATDTLDSVVNTSTAGAVEWQYFDVVCHKITPPNFSRGGSDALTVTGTFLFGRYREPNGTFDVID